MDRFIEAALAELNIFLFFYLFYFYVSDGYNYQ